MASSYLSPGVYVEEVSSGSKPIEAAGTAVAAFVGFAEKGPANQPTLVTNWTQYVATFGGFIEGSYLAHSVYGYFNNGGSLAYIVRIPHTEPSKESGVLALPAADRSLGPAIEVTAVEPGANVTVTVTPEPPADDAAEDSAPTFRVDVSEGSNAVESFEGLTLTPGDRNVETVVNKESTRVKVATKIDTSSLAADLAEEIGLTLIGFVRNGAMNVYTRADRVRHEHDAGA